LSKNVQTSFGWEWRSSRLLKFVFEQKKKIRVLSILFAGFSVFGMLQLTPETDPIRQLKKSHPLRTSENTNKAEEALKKDSEWAAPILWRCEFRNVLAFYIRNQNLELDKAVKIMNEAAYLMNDNEYDLTSLDVLKPVEKSGCSAYDCEYVALAQDIGIQLVMSDKKILQAFSEDTISFAQYIQ